MSEISFDLSKISAEPFTLRCRKSVITECTGKDPDWLKTALTKGVKLDLRNVMMQAGRHFSDRINPSVSAANRRRQSSTTLAWAIGSMMNPTIVSGRLVVEHPGDTDVVRLCSEIYGVGLGLEALSVLGVIDGRLIDKLSARFDYKALSNMGAESVGIEVKGTFKNGKGGPHRLSIDEKLKDESLKSKLPRGYDRNIGMICALRTLDSPGRFDLEICDPVEKGVDHFEEAARKVIQFYAMRFDEAIGNAAGVKILSDIAADPNLFKQYETKGDPALGTTERPSRLFWRSRLRPIIDGTKQEYLGSFWDTRKVSVPLPSDIAHLIEDHNIRQGRAAETVAFLGVNSVILDLIRARDFRGLLQFKQRRTGVFSTFSSDEYVAGFHIDPYGIIRGIVSGDLPSEIAIEGRE